MKKSLIFCFVLIVTFSSSSFSEIEIKKIKNKNIEVIKFQVPDRKFPGKDDVIAQIHIPKDSNKKIPLIIHQHGSSRDGMKFKKWGGRTDEWGKWLIKKGLERGYAVAVIDAFYKRGLKPTSKTKFPNSVRIALALGSFLSGDERFDKSKFFYTGFSYGAAQVMKLQDQRLIDKNMFRAAVAAEPGCNAVSLPAKSNMATLIIKGDESHYYPVACEYYFKMIKKMGNTIEYVSIPKVNHFFSLNGTIGKGKAFNGCSKNIVIRYPNMTFKFADGTVTNRKEVIKKCMTKESAGGENKREKLNEAIDIALDFIDKNNK